MQRCGQTNFNQRDPLLNAGGIMAFSPTKIPDHRTVLVPGDTDRACWRSQNPDPSQLLVNALHWMLRDQAPMIVTGEGLAEVFAWKTPAGHAIHILNYTNTDFQRVWFTKAYPPGAQQVRANLPGSKVRL